MKAITKDQCDLSKVVDRIRDDLHDAIEQHKNEVGWQPMFEVEDMEVELHVRFANETEGKVGIKAYVIDLMAKGKQTNEVTHKIKIRMKPVRDNVILLGTPEKSSTAEKTAKKAAKKTAKKTASR